MLAYPSVHQTVLCELLLALETLATVWTEVGAVWMNRGVDLHKVLVIGGQLGVIRGHV